MPAHRLVVCWILLAAAAGACPARAADVLTGAGRELGVIDGDTIEIGGQVVDLYGIDAPELGQVCLHNGTPWQCGLEAAFALRKFLTVEHAGVRCRRWPTTGGARRMTGAAGPMICEAGPLDLAHAQVASGHVVVLPNAFPDYRDLESRAKAANVGLWRGRFIPPRAWRTGRRLPGEEDLRSDLSSCPVKARIDDAGRKTYIVPTDRGFRSIRVAPSRGERCFLADEAARAAGWRRPSELAAAAAR